MKNRYAILDDKKQLIYINTRTDNNEIDQKSLLQWAEWTESFKNRVMKKTTLKDGTEVSTIFLGINHGFFETELWFETMIFGNDEYKDFQERYETYDDAMKRHDEICATIIKGNKP